MFDLSWSWLLDMEIRNRGNEDFEAVLAAYQDAVRTLSDDEAQSDERCRCLEQELDSLYSENGELRAEIYELKQELAALRADV